MEKVITNRQADSVVAAKLASAVVTSVKTKKTEKASKMVPDFQVTAKQVKDDLVLTVNYQDRKGEVKFDKRSIQVVNDYFTVASTILDSELVDHIGTVKPDVLASVVQDYANKMIDRANKMSVSSKSNPNMYRPAKKAKNVKGLFE